jgi:CheY-like chemotaxis protein
MSAVIEPLIGEDVRLVAELKARHDCVRADPAQLQQVVLNLVVNARDALAKGGRITIRTSESKVDGREAARQGMSAGPHVCLVVEDNGCGMKEEVRARIFEPFFTTKEHGTGTGLGMSMVYGIVKQAGGVVSVASKVGKGTRVTILLPRVPTLPPPKVAAKNENTRGGHETVLVAEDDSALRNSIVTLLSGRGYRVLQASDGRHAVRTARAHKSPLHLLLSDVVMPRMNGVNAAAAVRRLHPEVRVLFMSGYPAKAATVAFPEALLFKPFSRTALEQKVRETLGNARLPARRTHGQAP